MEYFTLQSDLSKTSLQSNTPEHQREAYLEVMHKLSMGQAFPDDYVYPINLQIGSSKKNIADIGLGSSGFAVSPRVQRVINDVASDQIQFIPIHHKPYPDTKYQVEETYAWMNVLNRVSCLEFISGEIKERRKFWNAQAKVWQERDPAVILSEIRFHPEKVEGLHIFRPDEASSYIFISTTLHDVLSKEKLIGLRFESLPDWLTMWRKVKNDNEGFYPADC